MQEFGLTPSQTQLMYSLEYNLVLTDIKLEDDKNKKRLKIIWLEKWRDSMNLILQNQKPTNLSTDIVELITNFDHLKAKAREQAQEVEHKFSLYLILLELTLFAPYYPIIGEARDGQFKGLKFTNSNLIEDQLKSFAQLLNLDSQCVKRFQSHHKEAVDGIKGGFNPWITGAVGAVVLAAVAALGTPIIAGILAPIIAPGLSGAAAVSSVLAFLGGGAIAAGGFGMAGGAAVIAGGGAILGAGSGVGLGSLFAQSPTTAINEAAKLEVVMKELIFIQKDIRLAQEIIKEQRQGIRALEDERDELMYNKKENEEKIKKLEEALDYLKRALQRNQDLL
ncbi:MULTISPECIES: hypothetical protein [unclassified Roseofilum]|uniref:hypothetical protein n=1 Tax=unclassified Roseofilum TaxID=2620099 RepID=UPI001B19C9D2|nr:MULTISPECIES: hypothetical protein [unclassified Roseofilum]MBP0010437.1 hypothetical protein [Roseofilum sp. Belize Diploria]MBP0034784.1 hypothetical protein [Roseofilum sp. Belize BBD 4]